MDRGEPSVRPGEAPTAQRIVQIVPALPPSVNGLGDYSITLAAALRQLGIETSFVATRHANRMSETFNVDGFDAVLVRRHAPEVMQRALERHGADTVVLHFSGYGYARWGLCYWLLKALRQWKAGREERRLITCFHELYAVGPPWRASFWSSLPQQQIAKALIALSSAIVTNNEMRVRRILQWSPDAVACYSPVFSNVGEPSDPMPIASRSGVAIVFGGAERRAILYSQHEMNSELGGRLEELGIRRIVDIGPPITVPEQLGPLPIEVAGVLPHQSISVLMADSRMGLVDYPLDVVDKSGIIAAYHAHQLVCVNLSTKGVLPSNIRKKREFVGLGDLSDPAVDLQETADAGHRWYSRHNVKATAKLFDVMVNHGVRR